MSERERENSPRFETTVKGAVTLFGSITGGVTAVYLVTLSLGITILAVVAAILVLLVLRLFR
ncbi:hypothetical protein [Kribbella endophytica]